MKAVIYIGVLSLAVSACASHIAPAANVREIPFDEEGATEGCTRLEYFFSGTGASQEEARSEVRANVSGAGGNAVVFVSGSVDLDPDTREITSFGENAVAYQCDD